MSEKYPDFSNPEHRKCIRNNLSNCGSGVIDDACAMIDYLEGRLSADHQYLDRWYKAAMKCYPLNWATDGRPETIIANIVRHAEQEGKASRET